MKIKLTLLVLVHLFLYESSYAQSVGFNGWFWQYPKPQGNTLRDIFIFDLSKAIAVGDLGTVIKTYDGGESWEVQHHAGGTDIDLYSVHFTDTLNGWAVGGIWFENKNVLLKTIDAGRTWIEVPTETDLPLNAVYFVDADTGIVVGEDGIVLRTTDGGISWDTRKMDNYIGYYLDIFRLLAITFTDKNNGWIVGAGYYGNQIYKTTDCGRTWLWNEQIITPKFYGGIYDICFIDQNNGFITGQYGFFAKTADGGTTWEYQNLWEKYQKEEYQYFYSISFIDSLNGWIVGGDYYAFILKTTDGGENWIEESNNNEEMTHHFYKIRFFGVNNGWIVGQFGMIYKTTDTGESWAAQREEKFNFRAVHFINENVGWAVGDSGIIMHTENGGTNWYWQNRDDSLILYSIFAIDSEKVITVGGVLNEQGFISGAAYLSTYDGGETWIKEIYEDIILFTSVFFVNDSTGWISGADGTLLRTVDKGNNWLKIAFDSSVTLATGKIQFVNQNIGWIGGTLKTIDGGNDWNNQVIPVTSLSSYNYVNPQKGWAVGSSTGENNIYKTTDGGDAWFPCGITPPGYNFSIQFINETTGWISGFVYNVNRTSIILKTTDGGDTWYDQKSPAKNEGGLSSIFFLDENIGWAVGQGIVRTTNGGGVVSAKDEWQNGQDAPETFHLYQNYPNPFNPTTIINYNLRESGFVSIKIYDMLGRDVATLINEYQNKGSYSINFNASTIGGGLSSGVYFYRLTTSSTYATKKMIVIR